MNLEERLTPAVLSYVGIQYQSMAPGVFTSEQWEYVNHHLRILSGFYGILNACDGVVPYRLEMQAKLPVDGCRDLYEFWGDRLYRELVKEDQVIVNLAVVGLFIPVTATLAAHYGLNPVTVCLTVGILCNVGIMFSVSSVPVAAAMLGSEGYSSPRDYVLYGLAVLAASSLIALGCGVLLGDLVFPMRN